MTRTYRFFSASQLARSTRPYCLPLGYSIVIGDFYYDEYAISWINKILAENNELVLYIAGKQEEQLEKVLLSAGVKDFIHLNSNAVQMLKEILIDRQVM